MISYIPSAYQHTRCWLALTAIRATLAQYRTGNKDLDAHINSINQNLERCCKDIRKKKPSSASNRAIKEACQRMEQSMVLSGLSDDMLFLQWGSSVWAALTLLEDCRNTCGAWFVGAHWHGLLRDMTILAEGLSVLDERIPEAGTEIYLKVA